MIKGNVFLGWSKENTLAKVLQKKLLNYGFRGIVGGKAQHAIDPGVGATVLNQMKKCSSAIMLFTPVDVDSGTILSGNMLFELGYLFGTLRLNKVLIVYLDVPMKSIPTDLHGMWDVQISKGDKSDEEIADEVIRHFLADQDSFLDEDKLDLLSEIEKLHYLIESHIESPIYYHDEMAQIVLLYGQAAYIFDDFISAEQTLGRLLQQNFPNDELQFAVLQCMSYFTLVQNLQDVDREDGNLYLSKRDYEKFRDESLDLIGEVKGFPETSETFKLMFLTIAYEYLTFANMMYAANPKTNARDEKFVEFRKFCVQNCLDYCEKMEEDDPDRNQNLAYLFKSYAYRNKAFLLKYIGEESDESFEESIKFRKKLYRRYHFSKTTAKHFVNHIRMEYFLALSDNLEQKKDKKLQDERIKELRKYIGDVTNNSFNRLYHIKNIEKIITDVENGNGEPG